MDYKYLFAWKETELSEESKYIAVVLAESIPFHYMSKELFTWIEIF